MLAGLPQQHVAMTELVRGPGLVQSKPQPPAPAAPCASGPGAGTYVGAPNTCPRSTSIFPGLLWSQTANTLCPRALALPPLLTPLCFSCSPSPLTDHRGWYYYNPWLNLNPRPILCFSGGKGGGEEGIDAILRHLLGPGAGAGFGLSKSPGRPCKGSPLLPRWGRCPGCLAASSERCPQVLELSLGEHQALAGIAGDSCSHNPPAAPRGLVSLSLSPHCLLQAGVTLPLFFLSTI